MSTARTKRKEEKRHKDVVEKLITPLTEKLVDFKFVESDLKLHIPIDFEKTVDITNAKYNKWAESFNKKSKHYTAKFNAVRDIIATEISTHEINSYYDLIVEAIYSKYQILEHEIRKLKKEVSEALLSELSVEEAVLYIKKQIK